MNETEILSGLFSPEPASGACPTFDFPGLQQSQPTPPLSTPPTPPVDQQPCSNEELTRQYSELESWHNAAKLEISRLQGQIDYFKGILQYAEKGLKIKLDESKRLQQENVELKVISCTKYTKYRFEIHNWLRNCRKVGLRLLDTALRRKYNDFKIRSELGT